MAQKNSPDALVAQTRFKNSYWQYRTYKADFYPMLSFDGTLPELNRSLSRITLPNGQDAFVSRSYIANTSSLSLSQKIGLTGGSVFVNTGLQRIDILTTKEFSYLSTPASIGINQPVFGFNQMRWARRIEPIRYTIAKRQFAQDLEDISLQTINLFFDYLNTQTSLAIALKNKANNDTLFKIAEGRFNLGKIAENDLLQIKLNYLNSDIAVEEARMNMTSTSARLKSFIGMDVKEDIALNLPENMDTNYTVDFAKAWQQAEQNSVRSLDHSRLQLDADKDVAEAITTSRFHGNLFASYGLNKRTDNINDIYKKPEDQEQIRFGVSVPILAWGKARASIETAKAQQMVTLATIKKDKIDFEQEIYIRSMRFNLQKRQLGISHTANVVADRRYFIAKQRYLIGKIDITDLNIAQNERDNAQRAYVDALHTYWQTLFGLRRATLYDFKEGKQLSDVVKLPE